MVINQFKSVRMSISKVKQSLARNFKAYFMIIVSLFYKLIKPTKYISYFKQTTKVRASSICQGGDFVRIKSSCDLTEGLL